MIDAPDRLAESYPRSPLVFADFFDAATQLLAEAPALSLVALTERIAELEIPDPEEDGEEDEELTAALAAVKTGEQWAQLFGAPGAAARYYAFHTFISACKAMKKEDPAKTGATLDCPIGQREDVIFWLNLAQSVLAWKKTPPAFFWLEGAAPRLLLSLGGPPSFVLLCLSKPAHDVPRLWPLKTADAAAQEQAKAAFDGEKQKLIEQDSVSNEALIAELART
jgi:hypothetical protein